MAQSRFNRETALKVIESVRKGNYLYVAAQSVGLRPSTIKYWIRAGEGKLNQVSHNADYEWFAGEVRKAEAECETGLVGTLLEKLPREPKLIIEFLARRWPHRWGKHDLTSIIKGDWRQTAVSMIRRGELTREDIEKEFGKDLAEELFSQVSDDIEIGESENKVTETTSESDVS